MVRAIVKGVKIEGLRELDKALGELPKAVARNTLKRALVRAGQPMAATMSALAPKDSQELAQSIIVSSRIKNTVGNAEYAAALRAGLGKSAALSAMRTARRSSGDKSFAEVHVGPAQAKNKFDAIKRIVQEFGSIFQPGKPFARPAWEQHKDGALESLKDTLWDEIRKSVARRAKLAARKAKII